MGTSWFGRGGRTAGVLMLPALVLTACDRGTTDPNGDYVEMARVEIMDRGQPGSPVVAEWTQDGGWEAGSELPAIDLDADPARVSVGVNIYDGEGVQLVEQGGAFTARYFVPDAGQDVLDMDHADDVLFHGDHVHIYGASEGTTDVVFVLWHIDHEDGATDPISIEVHGHDEDLATVEIIDRGETGRPVVATWHHDEGWDGELPVLNLAEAERVSLGARMYDGHGDEYTLEEDGEWSVRYWVPQDAPEGVVDLDHEDDVLFHGDHVHVYGEGAGETEIFFILWHVDHAEADTDPIPFVVIDE